jgi:hypothetical protein
MPIGVEMQMIDVPPRGYVFFVGVGAVSWNYKRQPTIALSTIEAKYMATSQCTKEAIWLRKLMTDVGLAQHGTTSSMCDNQGCIALAKNPTHHSRTKHIDIQHHFIRERLESGENRPQVLSNSRYGGKCVDKRHWQRSGIKTLQEAWDWES